MTEMVEAATTGVQQVQAQPSLIGTKSTPAMEEVVVVGALGATAEVCAYGEVGVTRSCS
jgi:hypothetical protein